MTDRIGKGLGAILSGGQEEKTEVQTTPSVVQRETSEPSTSDSAFTQALEEAKKYPKTTIFSPPVAAVLRYLWITKSRFSMSNTAREILEKEIKEKYPDLWERAEEELK